MIRARVVMGQGTIRGLAMVDFLIWMLGHRCGCFMKTEYATPGRGFAYCTYMYAYIQKVCFKK
jgi:hypothetical protein